MDCLVPVTTPLTLMWGCFRYLGQVAFQMRKGVDFVGQVHSSDEFFLKIRIDCGFDIFYPIGNFLRLSTFESIQQGNAGAVSGGIADKHEHFQACNPVSTLRP
jgi:hypothetical protein